MFFFIFSHFFRFFVVEILNFLDLIFRIFYLKKKLLRLLLKVTEVTTDHQKPKCWPKSNIRPKDFRSFVRPDFFSVTLVIPPASNYYSFKAKCETARKCSCEGPTLRCAGRDKGGGGRCT